MRKNTTLLEELVKQHNDQKVETTSVCPEVQNLADQAVLDLETAIRDIDNTQQPITSYICETGMKQYQSQIAKM